MYIFFLIKKNFSEKEKTSPKLLFTKDFYLFKFFFSLAKSIIFELTDYCSFPLPPAFIVRQQLGKIWLAKWKILCRELGPVGISNNKTERETICARQTGVSNDFFLLHFENRKTFRSLNAIWDFYNVWGENTKNWRWWRLLQSTFPTRLVKVKKKSSWLSCCKGRHWGIEI